MGYPHERLTAYTGTDDARDLDVERTAALNRLADAAEAIKVWVFFLFVTVMAVGIGLLFAIEQVKR